MTTVLKLWARKHVPRLLGQGGLGAFEYSASVSYTKQLRVLNETKERAKIQESNDLLLILLCY